jgi:uncharacterized membrane protein YhiD involved in acid resistance
MINLQTVAIRLGLALLFGAIIGVEREWRHKNAGIKTNTLVAIGSAAFAMMSNTFGATNHNPAQLAAAVVSGIGFIGAGVIIHRGANVQGVTTAATLWAGASMGVAIGLGYFILGELLFVAIIVVQFGLRSAEKAVSRRGEQARELELVVECDPNALATVNAAWTAFATEKHIVARRQSAGRVAGGMVWRAAFATIQPHGVDVAAIEERLLNSEGVQRVEVRQTAPWED